MKILAIETSGKVCAVALAENDKLIMEKIIYIVVRIFIVPECGML